jgi:uncharacterized damage-inducible protein DinB
LEFGRRTMEGLVADLDGADLVAPPTSRGGNHALWVMGHLAVSEASIVGRFIKGQEPALKEWQPLFALGSQPTSDLSKYPAKSELLKKSQAVRQETLNLLGSLSEKDLDKPTSVQQNQELFGTIGRCFVTMVHHQAFHIGQIAVVRRALGRKPAFA